jgi:hypothetical protein
MLYTHALSILNSRFVAGANTKFMLPRESKVEGSVFEVGPSAKASFNGTLFAPIGLHVESPPHTLRTFALAPSLSMTHSMVKAGLSIGDTMLRTSVLFNNHFAAAGDGRLNVMGIAVNGTQDVVLSAAASDDVPQSALCFGPAW